MSGAAKATHAENEQPDGTSGTVRGKGVDHSTKRFGASETGLKRILPLDLRGWRHSPKRVVVARIRPPGMSPNPNARDTGAATPASQAGTSLPSRSSNTIHFCLACGSEAKKRCNKCLKLGLMAFYCSRACQLGD